MRFSILLFVISVCVSLGWADDTKTSESPLELQVSKVRSDNKIHLDFCIFNKSASPVYVHKNIAYKSSVVNGVGTLRIKNLETEDWKILSVSVRVDGDDSHSISERDFIPLDAGYSICSSLEAPLEESVKVGSYQLVLTFHSRWYATENDQKNGS